MFKKILYLLVGLALASCGNSLSDDLGGGGGGGGSFTPEGKASFQYLSYMYDNTRGQSLNNTVLNPADEAMKLYGEEIQAAVNLSLAFPYEAGSSTKSSGDVLLNWYDSVPLDIKSQDASNLAKALEKYFLSQQGKDAFEVQKNELIATNDASLDTYMTDESAEFINTPLGQKKGTDYVKYAKLTTNAAIAIISQDYFSLGSMALSAITDAIFGGGDDGVSAALEQLAKAIQELQIRLAELENRVYKLEAEVVQDAINQYSANIAICQVKLNSVYYDLNQNLDVYPEIGGLRQCLATAYTNAIGIENKLIEKNYLPKVDVPWVLSYQFHKKIYSFVTGQYQDLYTYPRETKDMIYTADNPRVYGFENEGVSLDAIALLKRISLTKLLVMEKVYDGNELLKNRKNEIEKNGVLSDLALVQKLKNRINNLINEAKNSVSIPGVSDPTPQDISFLIEPSSCSIQSEPTNKDVIKTSANDYIDIFLKRHWGYISSNPEPWEQPQWIVDKDYSIRDYYTDFVSTEKIYYGGIPCASGSAGNCPPYEMHGTLYNSNSSEVLSNRLSTGMYDGQINVCATLYYKRKISSHNNGDNGFIEGQKTLIKEQLEKNSTFKDHIITAYAMLASWEIQLQAHIKAAEGL